MNFLVYCYLYRYLVIVFLLSCMSYLYFIWRWLSLYMYSSGVDEIKNVNQSVGVMTSQNTDKSTVWSTIFYKQQQRRQQRSALQRVDGGFSAQRASYLERAFRMMTWSPTVVSPGSLTHWGRNKTIITLQTAFLNVFSCLKIVHYRDSHFTEICTKRWSNN